MEHLHWTPPFGRQTAALKAAGLKTADLRAAGFKWAKAQRWEAENTEAAAAIIARLAGQVANDNRPTFPKFVRDAMDKVAVEVGATTEALIEAGTPKPPLILNTRLCQGIAKAREIADRLDRDAEAGERPRDMGPPKRMAQGMHARLDAAVCRRAATLLRAWADDPARLPTWKPNRKDAEAAAKRKLQSVPNGFHSYNVETSDPYPCEDPTVQALRSAYPIGEVRETPAMAIERLEAAVKFTPIPGFFPTPPGLIRRVIELADIRQGHLVLEPSAGSGHLAEAARALGATVHCCEVNHQLRQILTARELELTGEDFLAYADELSAPIYWRIVANPPFESGQDRMHIRRMYDLLRPGGRLVSVCSTGPFHRQAKVDQDFRDWLGAIGAEVEDVEPGAFAGPDAFRKTGVAVCLVTIDKKG